MASRAISRSARNQYASPQAVQDLGGGGLAQHVLDGPEQRLCHEVIVLRQDVQPDMLLGDPLHAAAEHAEVVDVTRIGDHGSGQRLGLGAGLAMMRLIEEVANVRVPEQDLVHAVRDGGALRFQSGHGLLHELNGCVAQSIGHLASPALTLTPSVDPGGLVNM